MVAANKKFKRSYINKKFKPKQNLQQVEIF